MKKLLVSLAAFLTVVFGFGVFNVSAAPVKMADGQYFDAQYYAQNNPDVVAAFGTDVNWLYLHYTVCGKTEGRLPYDPSFGGNTSADSFNAAYYAARYPDVAAVFGNDPTLLKMHYDLCGKAEGRFPNAEAELATMPGPMPVYIVTDSSVEQQVLNLVNAERAKYGLAPLSWDPVNLGPGAALRAQEISVYFSHTRPDGTSCFTAITNPGMVGENIAAGQRSPQEVMNTWMNSSGHRANILQSRYTRLGVGYFYDPSSRYKYYWVQMFSS
ncbi:MAG: hypothetical protein J6W85_10100 [Lachnospiraceae bacterium]|nr:hypothetical protein [Lachnospiraceae bacterium]MBP5763106.1 hypothetical protein [Lachnospiraceae bacterium]